MPNTNASHSESTLTDLIGELDEELNEEASESMPPAERAMSEVALELLRMEHDMLLPGSEQGVSERVKRIGDFIESRDF